jgi:5-methylcytosine-specific restriction endonuclease McrA
MQKIRPIAARFKLDVETYQALRQQIIDRDSWRCQSCGSMQNLQVHHLTFRSHMGSDSEQNLITLCATCHNRQHAT